MSLNNISLNNIKVVIVEDEIRIREGIIKLLNRYYPDVGEIYEAKTGMEGLDLIRRFEPDLVITDIRMPHMDGLSMLETLLLLDRRKFQVIILSAYSDFNYARRGIKLGVSEYLTKPVDVGEFHQAMRHIKEIIANERLSRRENPKTLHSFEAILAGMLSGQFSFDAEIKAFMETSYGIGDATEIALFCAYLGERYDDARQLFASVISSTLVLMGYRDFYSVFLHSEKEILFVITGDVTGIERHLQNSIARQGSGVTGISAVFGFSLCIGFEHVTDVVKSIHDSYSWNIPMGGDVMIVWPKILSVKPITLVYPISIEKDSIEALCALDYNRMNDQMGKMLDYVTSRVYSPQMIKKALRRYLFSLLGVLKQVAFFAYESIDEDSLLDGIARAVSRKELEDILYRLLESIVRKKKIVLGTIVGKAVSMVEEFYSHGITLDEVATALNMTPEYVSSQFVKELGVNFSTYMKNFRLGKARELLLGTDLKLYEIAERTGYNDAKYFSRVFKETEGVLPAEYRKNHR